MKGHKETKACKAINEPCIKCQSLIIIFCWISVVNLYVRGYYLVISTNAFEKKVLYYFNARMNSLEFYNSQCVNCIYAYWTLQCLSHLAFFNKNFVNSTVLPKIKVQVDFTKYFSNGNIFFHTCTVWKYGILLPQFFRKNPVKLTFH